MKDNYCVAQFPEFSINIWGFSLYLKNSRPLKVSIFFNAMRIMGHSFSRGNFLSFHMVNKQ